MLDTTYAVVLDSLQGMWTRPNDLRQVAWDGWMFRRASQHLQVRGTTSEVLAHLGGGHEPAVVRWRSGLGSMVYVNLNLGHQFLNVHPSAYGFLANLLAD